MNRYAPELALVTGGLLGGVFGAFVLFSLAELYSALVTGAVIAYPFAAYAVHNSNDPTAVLPPWLVTTAAALAGTVVFVDVIRLLPAGTRTALFGLLLALIVFLPAAAYGTQYGSPPAILPPGPIVGLTTLSAIGLVGVGATHAPLYGTASSILFFLAGALFAASRHPLGRHRRRQIPLAGMTLASGLVVIGVVLGGPLEPWVLGSLVAAFGPLIFYGLTADIG